MLNNNIINSATDYILKNNTTNKTVFDIYNTWNTQTGVIVNDEQDVLWILDLITDLCDIKTNKKAFCLFSRANPNTFLQGRCEAVK